MGITRSLLTARLRRLVDEGVLERVPYQDRPTRYEYRATEKGRELFPVVMRLLHWGDTHYPEPGAPRASSSTPAAAGGPTTTCCAIAAASG